MSTLLKPFGEIISPTSEQNQIFKSMHFHIYLKVSLYWAFGCLNLDLKPCLKPALSRPMLWRCICSFIAVWLFLFSVRWTLHMPFRLDLPDFHTSDRNQYDAGFPFLKRALIKSESWFSNARYLRYLWNILQELIPSTLLPSKPKK